MGPDDLTEDELSALIPEAVRKAYAEEQAFIDQKVASINKEGEQGWGGWVRKGTEWIPYVDDVFREEPKGAAAATSDVNQDARFREMVKKIETGLGEQLDDETKKNIRRDMQSLYNGGDPTE